MSDLAPVGFVGLGNMGAVLATNLVEAGYAVVCHDRAGPERTPPGGTFVTELEDIAARAGIVVLSLPDGSASAQVAAALASAADRAVTHVVDTSTVGIEASKEIASVLGDAGVGYVDAAVSGGVAGARARTLAVMYAGSDADCAAVEPVIEALSERRFRVGELAGLAQAMKLANNFLSATALVATSEAVAFGHAAGLDPALMIEVLDASSGRNTATSDKFPNHVLTGSYSSGFSNELMVKDVDLYVESVAAQGGPRRVADVTSDLWRRFASEEPDVDFTRIFPFIAGEELPT